MVFFAFEAILALRRIQPNTSSNGTTISWLLGSWACPNSELFSSQWHVFSWNAHLGSAQFRSASQQQQWRLELLQKECLWGMCEILGLNVHNTNCVQCRCFFLICIINPLCIQGIYLWLAYSQKSELWKFFNFRCTCIPVDTYWNYTIYISVLLHKTTQE